MSRTVETRRLIFRPFETADVDPLFEIQGDRQAMRFTFCAATRGESVRNLTAYAALEGTHGFAPWTVILKTDERVVAWGGLAVDPFTPGWGVEVGYFVHPRYWGRGIATEIVAVSLRHGFADLALPLIGAFARPANAASIRVLEKTGFRVVRYEPSLERNHYELSRAAWQIRDPDDRIR